MQFYFNERPRTDEALWWAQGEFLLLVFVLLGLCSIILYYSSTHQRKK